MDGILSIVSNSIEINIVGFRTLQGKEETSEFLSNFFQGFPDFLVTPIRVLYGAANNHDIVISEADIKGHQMGWWDGNPPSNKKFSTKGVISVEFDNSGKVKSILVYLNFKSIYKQLEILKI